MSAIPALPLAPLEVVGKKHAILSTVGFMILLPLGALTARYARTFTTKWLLPHFIFQFILAGPIIFAGWGLGWKVSEGLGQGHYIDTHQKIGLALLLLYLLQLTLGTVAHFFKFPTVFRGHRPPQNYLHAALGIAIFILANFQVHYGLYTEWPTVTGGAHIIPESAKHTWLALLVIFWVLYGLGMALLPRQLKQESEYRARFGSKDSGDHIAKMERSS